MSTMPHTLQPRFLAVSALVASWFFGASSRQQALQCSHIVARWQEGLVGWGGSNQKGAKTYQGRNCTLSLVIGILGGSTWHGLVLRASFWPLLASSVVNGEQGEEVGGGHERESSGARDGRVS